MLLEMMNPLEQMLSSLEVFDPVSADTRAWMLCHDYERMARYLSSGASCCHCALIAGIALSIAETAENGDLVHRKLEEVDGDCLRTVEALEIAAGLLENEGISAIEVSKRICTVLRSMHPAAPVGFGSAE